MIWYIISPILLSTPMSLKQGDLAWNSSSLNIEVLQSATVWLGTHMTPAEFVDASIFNPHALGIFPQQIPKNSTSLDIFQIVADGFFCPRIICPSNHGIQTPKGSSFFDLKKKSPENLSWDILHWIPSTFGLFLPNFSPLTAEFQFIVPGVGDCHGTLYKARWCQLHILTGWHDPKVISTTCWNTTKFESTEILTSRDASKAIDVAKCHHRGNDASNASKKKKRSHSSSS